MLALVFGSRRSSERTGYRTRSQALYAPNLVSQSASVCCARRRGLERRTRRPGWNGPWRTEVRRRPHYATVWARVCVRGDMRDFMDVQSMYHLTTGMLLLQVCSSSGLGDCCLFVRAAAVATTAHQARASSNAYSRGVTAMSKHDEKHLTFTVVRTSWSNDDVSQFLVLYCLRIHRVMIRHCANTRA